MRVVLSPAVLLIALTLPTGTVGSQVPSRPSAATVVIGGEKDQGGALEHPRAVASAGQLIIVLEQGAPYLKVFTAAGRLRQQVGAAGAGPREFRQPIAMAFDPTISRLAVFDPPNGRTTFYSLNDTLSFKASFRVPILVRAACYMRGKLFVLALHNGHLVHEVGVSSAELAVLRSVGVPRSEHPLASHPIYQNRLAQGVVFCDEPNRRVIVGSLSTGVVQLIGVDDNSQRTVTLPDFVPLEFEAIPNGLNQSVPAGGEWDEIVGIEPGSRGVRAIIGHADREHRGGGDYARYLEQTISATGVDKQRRTSQWQEIAATWTRTICYQGSPYPVLTIVAAPRCP